MGEPQPWTCSECGARLLWQREAIACPTHGVLCALPKYPDEKEQQ